MRVSLLAHTPEPERFIASAARLCYSSSGISELTSNLSDEDIRRILKKIMTSRHYSALEHASFTFGIEGISRACSHQLVRHRIASYNQQSQRYVKYTSDVECVIPNSMIKDEEARKIFLDVWDAAIGAYNELVSMGISQEDARYVLPNASPTKIIVTMNARELLHFFELRTCQRAQWEIRRLAKKMLLLVREICPTIFVDSGPSCFRGPCMEGEMRCDAPPKRETFFRDE
ncbi:MAG: FAD-dependent thymidylate synthase [Actinobacteria bacterium]|nr:FAD-dependent thymidylate synthase [Actinomycetota bacterium]